MCGIHAQTQLSGFGSRTAIKQCGLNCVVGACAPMVGGIYMTLYRGAGLWYLLPGPRVDAARSVYSFDNRGGNNACLSKSKTHRARCSSL